MSYKSVGNMRQLGLLLDSTEFPGVSVVLDDSQCELILFDRETNCYYKVLQMTAKVAESEHPEVMFELSVDLDNEDQVEFKGK